MARAAGERGKAAAKKTRVLNAAVAESDAKIADLNEKLANARRYADVQERFGRLHASLEQDATTDALRIEDRCCVAQGILRKPWNELDSGQLQHALAEVESARHLAREVSARHNKASGDVQGAGHTPDPA